MSLKNYNSKLYPFSSSTVTIKGNIIHYIDEGQGEAILFCHPPITSSFMYRNMVKELSKKFRCIALDFPGFGLSTASSNYTYSIQSQAEIIEELLIHLKISSVYPVIQEVGGHSAMAVFLKNPDWLKGIILTDTIIFPVSQYPRLTKMLTLVNSSFFNFINTNFNIVTKSVIKSVSKNRPFTEEEKNTYLNMFDNKTIRHTSTTLLYELVKEEKLLSDIQKAFETRLASLPALLIYGENDPLTKLGVPQRINKMLKNSELYFIKNEEHFPHEGGYLQMSNIITDWIPKAISSGNMAKRDVLTNS